MDKPWRDEGALRSEYVDNGRSTYDLANEWGCSRKTISNWMGKYGIPRRSSGGRDGKHRDKEWLIEMYHDKKMPIGKVADEAGVAVATIQYWMKKHDIGSRGWGELTRYAPASFVQDDRGYERWYTRIRGESATCYVHQLLAIAEGADPHFIFGGSAEIHHINGIPWDNRPGNLMVLTREEHQEIHRDDYVNPWVEG